MFDHLNQKIGICEFRTTPSITNSSLSRLSQRWIGGKNADGSQMSLAGALSKSNILVTHYMSREILSVIFTSVSTLGFLSTTGTSIGNI